jgi:MSHA biogenesis protein MshQ
MGRRTLQLAAPGGANNGSVTLTVNLGASASGNTCTAVGAGPGPATTTANFPHLQGNWTGANYDQNPTARATFGVSRGANEVIFVRENF